MLAINCFKIDWFSVRFKTEQYTQPLIKEIGPMKSNALAVFFAFFLTSWSR